MDNVELEIREDALNAIAKLAMKRKTGARGLRTIMETALLNIMYELPDLDNVDKVVIDRAVIEEGKDPYLVYGSISNEMNESN